MFEGLLIVGWIMKKILTQYFIIANRICKFNFKAVHINGFLFQPNVWTVRDTALLLVCAFPQCHEDAMRCCDYDLNVRKNMKLAYIIHLCNLHVYTC